MSFNDVVRCKALLMRGGGTGWCRGKTETGYSPSMNMGGYVVVINAEKVIVTGRKTDQKMYRRHSGRPGGLKEETFRQLQKVKRDFLATHPLSPIAVRPSVVFHVPPSLTLSPSHSPYAFERVSESLHVCACACVSACARVRFGGALHALLWVSLYQ
jgi:Ribosomal protein L13